MMGSRDDDDFNKMEIKMSDDMPLNNNNNNNGSGTHSILGDVPAFQSLSRQKRRQYLASALCAAGVLFLWVVYLVVHRSGNSSSTPGATDSEESASEAFSDYPQQVRAMIDKDTDPCDDFYQYSCGKWRINADIPGDKSSISASFSRVQDQNELVLQEIVHENLPFVGELYNSCMNTTEIDAKGVTPLRGYLEKISSALTHKDLFTVGGELSKLGPTFLTGLGVQADAKDATLYLLYASQSGLSLPDRNYYVDTKQWDVIVEPYQEYLAELFQLAGYSETDAQANRDLVVSFEKALAQLYTPKEELLDPVKTYNPVFYKDAMAKYPLLIGGFLNGTGILNGLQTAKTNQSTFLSVETPLFFEKAEKMVTETPLKTLKVIFAYHILRDFAGSLSEPFVETTFSFFSKRIAGQKQRSPRWKVCLRRVIAHFPDLMGKYYFIKKFDHASELLAKQMVSKIENAMTNILKDQVEWLDDDTRDAAIKKMDQIANLIGHSTNQDHFPFILSTDSYWENMETLNQYAFNKSVSKIARPVDRDEWFMAPSDVNAYYNAATNQIVFPAGILQPPFFDKSAHASQNFGAIGAIIGHEITHGFDDNGRYYDGEGNLVDWWDDHTDAAFKKRTQCLVDQYAQFQVISDIDEVTVLGNVNGKFTLGENMADNGGLKIAFQAMESYLFDRDETEELQEPSSLSRATAEKLYFVSFAQAFCSKSSDEAMVRRLNTDPHAPEKWRVNGAMMNSEKFAKVFECKAGAPMAPKNTCQVW